MKTGKFCWLIVTALGGCSGPAQSGEPAVADQAKGAALEGTQRHASGCADHEDEEAPADRERAGLTVSWRSPTEPRRPTIAVKVLGFNDFHGQLSEGRLVAGRPVGGAAVLATYLKTAGAAFEDRTLIIHAGDHVGASPPESALLQDEPSIEFLNSLSNRHCRGARSPDERCNVIGTLGNHEFDEGTSELLRLVYGGNHAEGPFLSSPYPGARFPYVSSNVVATATGRHLLPPSVIRRLGGVRVGVIGAVLKETPTIVTPTGVAGLTFLDEASSINLEAQKLKRRGVRTILVTLHQGARQAPTYEGSTDPLSSVATPISDIVSKLDDEVDVVISGHSHAFTNALVNTESGHPILVTQAFSSGTAYGDIDLEIDRTTGDVIAKTARIVTTYSDVAPGSARDPEVQAVVDAARTVTAPLVSQVVAEVSGDVNRTQNAAGESALGDLIADSQRAATGTDFAFMNPGGIRADLLYAADPANASDAPGTVLWGELFTIQPFGNSLVTLTLTGQQVYDLLSQQFVVGRMLQVSGLTYTWDSLLPAADRVLEIRKDGLPIDRALSYSVTVNNFLAAGGDGFSVLVGGQNPVGGAIDLDALIEYLKSAAAPVSSPLLDRITRIN